MNIGELEKLLGDPEIQRLLYRAAKAQRTVTVCWQKIEERAQALLPTATQASPVTTIEVVPDGSKKETLRATILSRLYRLRTARARELEVVGLSYGTFSGVLHTLRTKGIIRQPEGKNTAYALSEPTRLKMKNLRGRIVDALTSPTTVEGLMALLSLPPSDRIYLLATISVLTAESYVVVNNGIIAITHRSTTYP